MIFQLLKITTKHKNIQQCLGGTNTEEGSDELVPYLVPRQIPLETGKI